MSCERKHKKIETKFLKSKYICAKNIKTSVLNSTTVNTDVLNSTTVNTDVLNSTTVNTDVLKSTTVKSSNINTDTITVNRFTNFPFQNYNLFVGPTRDFKNINDLFLHLTGKVVLGSVNVNIDPGTYDGFTTSGINMLNDTNLSFIGDRRTIAGLTFVNNSNSSYSTFTTTTQGSNTKIEITNNDTATLENFESYGLVIGDKIVFYINDISIPKQDRFIYSNVINVDDNSFTVDINITFLFQNSSVTFLPNVYIKSNYEEILVTNPDSNLNTFKRLSNLSVTANSSFLGFSLLPSDDFTSGSAIINYSTNSNFSGIVVLGTKYQEKTIDSVTYKGFTTSSAYTDETYNQLIFDDFTILGTGYNPIFDGLGPFSVNNCSNVVIQNMFAIGVIENTEADGILYFFRSQIDINNIVILGTEDAVGLFFSKSSAFFASNVLISNGVLGLLIADDSSIELSSAIIENCDIGVELVHFSKAIFNNLTLNNVGQDFCIKDLSQVLRDDNVIIAPSC